MNNKAIDDALDVCLATCLRSLQKTNPSLLLTASQLKRTERDLRYIPAVSAAIASLVHNVTDNRLRSIAMNKLSHWSSKDGRSSNFRDQVEQNLAGSDEMQTDFSHPEYMGTLIEKRLRKIISQEDDQKKLGKKKNIQKQVTETKTDVENVSKERNGEEKNDVDKYLESLVDEKAIKYVNEDNLQDKNLKLCEKSDGSQENGLKDSTIDDISDETENIDKYIDNTLRIDTNRQFDKVVAPRKIARDQLGKSENVSSNTSSSDSEDLEKYDRIEEPQKLDIDDCLVSHSSGSLSKEDGNNNDMTDVSGSKITKSTSQEFLHDDSDECFLEGGSIHKSMADCFDETPEEVCKNILELNTRFSEDSSYHEKEIEKLKSQIEKTFVTPENHHFETKMSTEESISKCESKSVLENHATTNKGEEFLTLKTCVEGNANENDSSNFIDEITTFDRIDESDLSRDESMMSNVSNNDDKERDTSHDNQNDTMFLELDSLCTSTSEAEEDLVSNLSQTPEEIKILRKQSQELGLESNLEVDDTDAFSDDEWW